MPQKETLNLPHCEARLRQAIQIEYVGMEYVCGAGLSVNRGVMKNAIVYTGGPHSFQFVLQTKNYASKTSEEMVERWSSQAWRTTGMNATTTMTYHGIMAWELLC